MTLYGTPETATQMLDNMAKGFGIRSMVEGFVNGPTANGNHSNGNGNGNGATGEAPDVVGNLLAQVGNLIKPAISKVVGGNGVKTTAETSDEIAKRLAEDPEFLKALQAALKTAPLPVLIPSKQTAQSGDVKV